MPTQIRPNFPVKLGDQIERSIQITTSFKGASVELRYVFEGKRHLIAHGEGVWRVIGHHSVNCDACKAMQANYVLSREKS